MPTYTASFITHELTIDRDSKRDFGAAWAIWENGKVLTSGFSKNHYAADRAARSYFNLKVKEHGTDPETLETEVVVL